MGPIKGGSETRGASKMRARIEIIRDTLQLRLPARSLKKLINRFNGVLQLHYCSDCSQVFLSLPLFYCRKRTTTMAAIIAVSAAAFVELCRCRLCPILPPSPVRTKLRTVELGSVAPPRARSLAD